ncbi:MAG: hypothetical protein ACYTGW_21835 [Planctomycetota bacterium]
MRVDSKVWAAAAVPVLLLGLSVGGCTVSALDKHDPAPHLGRPGWVRVAAGFGGWIGGGVGALASVALLPVTYPVSLLAEEPLGCSQTEFRFMPVSMAAATGHYVLGAPLDALDFLFRRAWLEEDKTPGYEFTPMPAPKLRDPATEPVQEPPKKEPPKKEPPKKEPEPAKKPVEKPEDRDRPARTKKDGTD